MPQQQQQQQQPRTPSAPKNNQQQQQQQQTRNINNTKKKKNTQTSNQPKQQKSNTSTTTNTTNNKKKNVQSNTKPNQETSNRNQKHQHQQRFAASARIPSTSASTSTTTKGSPFTNTNNNNTKNHKNNTNSNQHQQRRSHSSNPFERSKQNTALHHQALWENTNFVHCLVAHGDNEVIREYFVASASTFVSNNPSASSSSSAPSSSSKQQNNNNETTLPSSASEKPITPPLGYSSSPSPVIINSTNTDGTKTQTTTKDFLDDNSSPQQQPTSRTSPKSAEKKQNNNNVASSGNKQQQQQELMYFYVGKKTALSEVTKAARPPFSTKTCLKLCPHHGEHHDLFPPLPPVPSPQPEQQSTKDASSSSTSHQVSSPLSKKDKSKTENDDQEREDDEEEIDDEEAEEDDEEESDEEDEESDEEDDDPSTQICPYSHRCEFIHADPTKLTKVTRSMFTHTLRDVHVAVSSRDRTRLYRIAVQDVAEVTAGLLLMCYLQQNDIIMTGALRVCSYFFGSGGYCKKGSKCLYAHVNKNDLVRVERTMGDRPIDSTTTLQTIFAMTLPQGVVAAAANRFSQDLGLKTLGDVQCLSNKVFSAVAHSIMQRHRAASATMNKAQNVAAANSRATSDDHLLLPPMTTSSSSNPSSALESPKQHGKTISNLALMNTGTSTDGTITTTTNERDSQQQQPTLTYQQKAICVLALESIRSLPPATTPITTALLTFPNVTADAAERFINAFRPTHDLRYLADLQKLKLKTLLHTAMFVTSAPCMQAVEALRARLVAGQDTGEPRSIAIEKLPPESLHRFLAKTICEFRNGHAHHSWRKADATRPIVTSVITFVNPEECHCAFQIQQQQQRNAAAAAAAAQQQQQQQNQHKRIGSIESGVVENNNNATMSNNNSMVITPSAAAAITNVSSSYNASHHHHHHIDPSSASVSSAHSGNDSRSNSASHAVKQRAILDVARKLEAEAFAKHQQKQQQQQQHQHQNSTVTSNSTPSPSSCTSTNAPPYSVTTPPFSENHQKQQENGEQQPPTTASTNTNTSSGFIANLPRNETDPVLSNIQTSSLAFPTEPPSEYLHNKNNNNSKIFSSTIIPVSGSNNSSNKTTGISPQISGRTSPSNNSQQQQQQMTSAADQTATTSSTVVLPLLPPAAAPSLLSNSRTATPMVNNNNSSSKNKTSNNTENDGLLVAVMSSTSRENSVSYNQTSSSSTNFSSAARQQTPQTANSTNNTTNVTSSSFASSPSASAITYLPFSEGKKFTLPSPPGHWCRCNRSYEIGVNYELSTPAGSRCSEQNVMGKLASLGVPTHCIREVFVHGSGVKEDPNPLFPCGVCESMFKRISKDVQEHNQHVGDVTLYMFDQIENPRKLVSMNFHEISHRQGTMFKKFVEEDLRDEQSYDDEGGADGGFDEFGVNNNENDNNGSFGGENVAFFY